MEPSSSRRTFLGALVAGGVASQLPSPAVARTDAVGQQITYEEPLTTGRTPDSWTVASPDGALSVTLDASDDQLRYRVERDGEAVIENSPLGLAFADGTTFGTDPTVTGTATDSVDRTWEPPWGRYSEIRERYNEVAMSFDGDRPVTVTVRAFPDGVGFRYTIHGDGDFEIVDERTAFDVAEDGRALWYHDDPNKYEHRIAQTPISEAGDANTPMTMTPDGGPALSIHEADLTDFAAMRLSPDGDTRFRANLVTWPDGTTKVRAGAPHVSPWRTVTVGDGVGDLIESNLIINLAQPSKIEDPSWIDPGKYVGIWWEIHIGESSWAPGDSVGATTANAKRYIDFCADHGIPNLLAEGWNVGWGHGIEGFDDQDFLQSTEYFDLQEVLEYGAERGVRFVAHNETGAQAARYDEHMAAIFAQYNEWSIPAVKNGYVNPPFHNGQKQQSQWAVNHYRRMVATAAEHEIMVNPHEPIKPTGERRTWPNFMTREGVQGMEYQNFTGGLPADHSVHVAQTRMLAGPVDYTPGIFDLTDDGHNVNTTRARQLSHYPVLFSGLQMVADLPNNYTDDAGDLLPEFQFIEDVPASWDETRVVDAALGEYVSIARRKGHVWYVGTQTGQARTLELELDFLTDGPYVAEIYADAPETSLQDNPEAVAIEERPVAAGEAVEVSMANGGGHAMRLVPADADVPYCPRLSVSAPERADVGTTTITGTTGADSVRIETPDGETIQPVVEDDSFEVEVPITAGENTVVVSVPKRNASERCEEALSIVGVDLLAEWSDPVGDDHGPGEYTYPTRDVFNDGDFDLTGLTVHRQGSTYRFVASLATEPTNPWGFEGGFGKQFLQVYVRHPGDSAGSREPAPGVNATMAAPYQVRILADGENGVRVQDPTGKRLATGEVTADGSDIAIDVPADVIGELGDARLAVLLVGYDGTEDDFTRALGSECDDWVIGGADGENAPAVLDCITPRATSQTDALAYTADQRATIPYRLLDESERATVATDLDGDGRYEDIDGDGRLTPRDTRAYARKHLQSVRPDERFDFDGDGLAGTPTDLLALFEELLT